MRKLGCRTLGLSTVLWLLGCQGRGDADAQRRPEWVHQQTAEKKLFLLEYLNQSGDIEFGDGWYAAEHDPKTGGAWRWMSGRGVTRLTSKPGARAEPCDMVLKVFGWAPREHLGGRNTELEFSVSGHVLGRLVPPQGALEHVIIVPKHLLEYASQVDFVITVTNTARPAGDWRDLGFATTGFHWQPAPPI